MAQLIRMSTAAVEPRHRTQLAGDVMARELAGGTITASDDPTFACDWTLVPIAPGLVIADSRQAGLVARRDAARVRDGDDDVSIFIGRRGIGRLEQNDRRERLGPGDAVVVAHARPVASEWPATEARVVRLPRAVCPRDVSLERVGGVRLAAGSPALTLLAAYVDATMAVAADAVPAIAARHLAELGALVIAEAAGAVVPRLARGTAVHAARYAAVRDHVARHYADPGLTMARVAAAIGVSERSAYLVCARAGVVFTDLLYDVRLARAREALAAGFAGRLVDLAFAVGFSDLSHFNRRFRARYGMTPGEARRA